MLADLEGGGAGGGQSDGDITMKAHTHRPRNVLIQRQAHEVVDERQAHVVFPQDAGAERGVERPLQVDGPTPADHPALGHVNDMPSTAIRSTSTVSSSAARGAEGWPPTASSASRCRRRPLGRRRDVSVGARSPTSS
jgi:hypothetical protein